MTKLSADQRRALEVLAGSPNGCTEAALLLAYGFDLATLTKLIRIGFVSAEIERMRAVGKVVEMRRIRITTEGLRELAANRVEERRHGGETRSGQGATVRMMAKRVSPEMLADTMTVQERALLVYVATHTDWLRAGITRTIARRMMARRLITRQARGRFTLTDQGRAVLEALMVRAATTHPEEHC